MVQAFLTLVGGSVAAAVIIILGVLAIGGLFLKIVLQFLWVLIREGPQVLYYSRKAKKEDKIRREELLKKLEEKKEME